MRKKIQNVLVQCCDFDKEPVAHMQPSVCEFPLDKMWGKYIAFLSLLALVGCHSQEDIAGPARGLCHLSKNQWGLTCNGYQADVFSLKDILNDQGLSYDQLKQLKNIQIQNGKVRLLSRGAFNELPLITHIAIQNMSLQTIENAAFMGLSQLKQVDLSYNKISHMPTDLFKTTGIKALTLDGNEGLTIPTNGPLLDAPKLRWLSLKRCDIQHFPGAAFTKTPYLHHLDLSYNRLEQLPEVVFKNITISELNLSNNKFKTLDIAVFRGIQDFPKQPHLVIMANNDWHCDCRLAQLIIWLTQDVNTREHMVNNAMATRLKFDTKCKTPTSMNEKSWDAIEEWSCVL